MARSAPGCDDPVMLTSPTLLHLGAVSRPLALADRAPAAQASRQLHRVWAPLVTLVLLAVLLLAVLTAYVQVLNEHVVRGERLREAWRMAGVVKTAVRTRQREARPRPTKAP